MNFWTESVNKLFHKINRTVFSLRKWIKIVRYTKLHEGCQFPNQNCCNSLFFTLALFWLLFANYWLESSRLSWNLHVVNFVLHEVCFPMKKGDNFVILNSYFAILKWITVSTVMNSHSVKMSVCVFHSDGFSPPGFTCLNRNLKWENSDMLSPEIKKMWA